MKQDEYYSRIDLVWTGAAYLPANDNAMDLANQTHKGEITSFTEITARDIKFHQTYFHLLNFIYDYMPKKFQKRIAKKSFYKMLKEISGEYKVLFKFADGREVKEYTSIAFGNMSQKHFEDYIRNQLTFIYNDIIYPYFPDKKIFDGIVETIEQEYISFLRKLG